MAVADEVRAPGAPVFESPAGRGPGEPVFDRTPPQDIAAEQCVLGGMMLSKDAIADVVEILRSTDFYRPAHATIYDTILSMYGRGDPADAITVAAALTDSGEINRIGGAAYLHTLISLVPTAANTAYYARIVAERAVLRRLVEAGTRIVAMGYGSASGGGRDVDDVVDMAQQVIYDVTERRTSDDFAILADLLQPALDDIEAAGSRDGLMAGVPTGFGDLDRLLNGLHPGQLIVVAGRPGLGKALAVDTPLPTPDGWTTMGAVRVGDRLLGADGRPATVVAASDVAWGRDCYEVEFSDGATIVADAEHLWAVTTRALATPAEPTLPGLAASNQVITTEHIAATLSKGRARRPNHAVINTRPLQLPDCDLPIPPYALGAWLGAGADDAAVVRGVEPEVVAYIEGDDVEVTTTAPSTYVLTSLIDELADLRLFANKHIPPAYLRASLRQRRELLAGLMDTAGRITAAGNLQLPVASPRLARDAAELIASLGWRCRTCARDGEAVLGFAAADDVFRVEELRLTHKERRRALDPARVNCRFIVDVRPVASVPVRCVMVDHADHLYLAGRGMIPTHNSTVAMDFVRTASVRHNLPSAVFSLEMSKIEIVTRLLSAEARVPLRTLRSGELSDDDWTRLARRMGEISEAPIFIDDTPNLTLMEVRAKARRLRQRNDLKLVVVDYLQLMTSPKRVENRQQEVADLSRGLKLLAKEIECPVVAVSQLNRGPEQRNDKRPQLSDLRESGCLVASTRLLRADTNAEVTLGELIAAKATGIPVWAVDERLRLVPRTLTHAFPSGRRTVYRMRLSSGKEIEATSNHRFLTVDGWTPLAQLAPAARIATPRHIPTPLQPRDWPASRLVKVAGAFGEGCGARLPEEVFGLRRPQLSLFLRHLWATGGSVTVDSAVGGGRVWCHSASRLVLDELALLLMRFGITARIEPAGERGSGYVLEICGRDDQRRFLRATGQLDADAPDRLTLRPALQRAKAAIAAAALAPARPRAADTLAEPSAGRLATIAAVLDEADLDLYATNDVLWDEVISIEAIGEHDVFDATVLGLHNFVANGIIAHNSIEQDADVVILLHRDDAYDRESPRAGEADFIVAKHRNGPTDTVTVAAQLHFSRFVDMAVT